MKKKTVCFCTLLCVPILLSGCVDTNSINSEEEVLVSQYATALLLKYDSENHSRLTDVTETVSLYEEAEIRYEEQKKAYEEAENAETVPEETKEATPSDTESIESEDTTAEIPEEVTEEYSDGSLAEFLNLSGINLEYAGCDLMQRYPEDESDLSKSISADSGKSLLVLYFNAGNVTDTDVTMDVLSEMPSFKISINGGSDINVEKTISLDDDLSTYYGKISAGSKTRLVLVTDVDADTSVDTLDLKATLNGDSFNMNLK